MKNRVRNIILTLLCCAVAGTLLLMFIFALPVERAKMHVSDSLYDMIHVLYDPNGSEMRKHIVESKDDFTDDLMVQNALEHVEGKSILEHAMYVYHYDLSDGETWLTEESLQIFLGEGIAGLNLREYSKYWHGYLVWLKPLLMCFSWKVVETLLVSIQILFMIFLIVLSFRKKHPGVAVNLIVTYLYMKPVAVLFSLTLSTCWWITLTAVCAMVCMEKYLDQRELWEECFLLIGVFTAYFDFLTYPIMTLSVPLCVYLILQVNKSIRTMRRIKAFFWLCAEWVIGYIGMWSLKWILAEVTCQSGTLRKAAWAVIYRTGPLDGYGSAFTGISRTLRDVLGQYDGQIYAIGFMVMVIVAAIMAIQCGIIMKFRDAGWKITMLQLLAVSVFPVIWLSLTQNHTAIHCSFTFRIMAVTVMAICSMTICSLSTMRLWKRMDNEHV